MSALDADIQIQLESGFQLDVAFQGAAGETIAVLGPNGAGKTTLLHALAGLRPLDGGCITLDGMALDNVATGKFLPPEDRSVGFMFQDYLLFDHLTVRDNIAFGPRARGASKAAAGEEADRRLELVGLADRADARPHTLSGGEAQRVALARALAGSPRLLLLDEPLSALDATTRDYMRRDLRELLSAHDGPRILVTHDPLDAAVIADRVLVVEEGRTVQHGTIAQLAQRPATRYVADLVGVNLLRGIVSDGSIELPSGALLVSAEVSEGAIDGVVLAAIHPHAVSLHRQAPETSARNTWSGHVEAIEALGSRVRVRIGGAVSLVAEVTPSALDDLGIVAGIEVWCTVKATEVSVYPA
ncbi:MAG: ABC transporter ATP-binding protein [Acidimicrobiia bacterium]|nr:ABC transporter ATP-binding protein [Acidimicrobiia bacterium]